jgi:hypothetical protein
VVVVMKNEIVVLAEVAEVGEVVAEFVPEVEVVMKH